MKNKLLLSTPTAKIQIGNQASITLDTATTHGKKSYQISIVTENDSINKVINEVKEEVLRQNEDTDSDFQTSIAAEPKEKELEVIENIAMTVFPLLIILVPIVLGIFYAAYSQRQKRLWREALLNKGLSLNEILESENFKKNQPKNQTEELESFEKRKSLKRAIVFGAVGIAIMIGTIMDGFGYFLGTMFILLGLGFWYYNERIK